MSVSVPRAGVGLRFAGFDGFLLGASSSGFASFGGSHRWGLGCGLFAFLALNPFAAGLHARTRGSLP